MTLKTKIIMPLFLSLVLCSGISASEIPPKKSIDSRLEEYVLDELRVTADNSLRSLRKEIRMANEVKYEIFNELNSTDDFDITCKWQTPTGTLLRQWGCEPGYMVKAREEEMDLYRIAGWNLPPRSDLQLSAQFAEEHRALKKEMIDLALKHPELATAMIRADEAQRLYEDEHRRRFKESIMIGHPEPDKKTQVVNEFDFWQSVFVHHVKGSIQDDIWKRWDSWCKKKLQRKPYRKSWASADKDKYIDEFKVYVNTIISGE